MSSEHKFYDGMPAHVQRIACIVPGANTATDRYDPTLTNYADAKSDLIYLLKSPYGKHEIELIDNTHKKQSTIAGGAATRATVQNAPNTTQHIVVNSPLSIPIRFRNGLGTITISLLTSRNAPVIWRQGKKDIEFTLQLEILSPGTSMHW